MLERESEKWKASHTAIFFSRSITALLKQKLTLPPYQSNLTPFCSHMVNSAVVKLTFLPLLANFYPIQFVHEVYCTAT